MRDLLRFLTALLYDRCPHCGGKVLAGRECQERHFTCTPAKG
jgi:DNA-directed RNA polymerase subunit RPC12/RpoP